MINKIYDLIINKPRDKKILILSGSEISHLSNVNNNIYGGDVVGNIDLLFKKRNLYESPEELWSWVIQKRMEMINKKPNINHYAISKLQKYYDQNISLITQNIDDLHTKAGSFNTIEFNGNINKDKVLTDEEFNKLSHKFGLIPTNYKGQYLKPDILLRNEKVDKHIRLQTNLLAQKADICIVVGCIETQHFFSELPMVAQKYNNAYVIEINNQESLTGYPDMYIKQKPELILPIMIKLILEIEEGEFKYS